jgi:diguanylate cyclase (GGDEF)-like protein
MIRAVFRHAPKARGDASNQNENRNRQEPARVQSARQASLPMTQTTDKSRDPRAQRVAGGEAALPQALMNALDALGIGAYAKDGAGRYLQLNASAQELLGVNESDAIGRTDADLLAPALALALRAADQAAAGQTGVSRSEHAVEVAGQRRDLTAARIVLDAPGQSGAVIALWLDSGELRRRDSQLRVVLTQLEEQQRANDALRREAEGRAAQRHASGGLVQQEQFIDHLQREVDLSQREHREFAVVYVSVDPPPQETRPHDERGRERVLDALGRLLRSNTRAMDAPCRLDGERFAVLLSGIGLATAHSRMEGLRRQCATQIVVLDGEELRFTVSMGVASFPHTASTLGELLEAAENALSEAQRRGGNHVALASIRFASGEAAAAA